MLKLAYKRTTYIWEDESNDLCFSWDSCCPQIRVSYLGDCQATVIETLEIDDPILHQEDEAYTLKEVEATIVDFIQTYSHRMYLFDKTKTAAEDAEIDVWAHVKSKYY